jgi:regulation of enolase protein 1 (concanavalin A-like superfamily)
MQTDGGTITLNSRSYDIWGSTDSFTYLYRSISGNVTMTARVVGLTNTETYAAAGVMMRATLNPDSVNVFTSITVSNGPSWRVRATTGGTTGPGATQGPERPPYWVRVVRQGGTLSGYGSTDGVAFTLLGTRPDLFGNPVNVGLVVHGINMTTTNVAVFDNVVIQ